MGIFDKIVNSVVNNIKSSVNGKVNQMANQAANSVSNAVSQGMEALLSKSIKKETVTFKALPKNADELKADPNFDLKDPEKVVALTVAAFCAYGENKSATHAMLNVLKGPSPLSNLELSFINDRFMDDQTYKPFSYFAGATVENDYTPSEPYKISVYTLEHSKDQESEGYLTLFVQSSGADSPREVVLRKKASTGEWFLWTFEGILLDIRKPQSQNPWA